MRHGFPTLFAATLALSAANAAAQAATATNPPVRPLGPVDARSAMTFEEIRNVVALSDGRVLVNDGLGNVLVVLDNKLALQTVILDTLSAGLKKYPRLAAGLVQALGDSALFVDPVSISMVVIEPSGRPGRTVAPPPGIPSAVSELVGPSAVGTPLVSPRLGLLFARWLVSTPPRAPQLAGTVVFREDSLALVAMRLDTRMQDTIAMLGGGRGAMYVYDSSGAPFAGGRGARGSTAPPMSDVRPVVFADRWAMTTDGSLAILREQTYTIDWLKPDGTPGTSTRLPYAWQRLDDAEKQRIVDSVNAPMIKRWEAGNASRDSVLKGLKPNPLARGRAGAPAPPPAPPPALIDASVIPDFKPPVGRVGRPLTGDGDNNVWIRHSSKPRDTGLAYDVVNQRDGLIARIKLPEGRALVGFGPGRVVYMTAMDGGRVMLERAKW